MPFFCKKPVVIEAMLFDGTIASAASIFEWINDATAFFDGSNLIIKTLEGNMMGSPGDWIIKGVSGEFYPCKPEIFAVTYDLVSAPQGDGQ